MARARSTKIDGMRARKSAVSAEADPVISWLLEGDPAIAWQTLRDLAGASERTVARARRRVAREGWGARLLGKRDARGAWAAGQSSDGLSTWSAAGSLQPGNL